MNDTADQLERQIETQRANVEDTLDKLKGRLSVEQVVDDLESCRLSQRSHWPWRSEANRR